MFRGGTTPRSLLGLQNRGLTGAEISVGISRIPDGRVAGPVRYSMFKTPERKESSSRKGGTIADNPNHSLGRKKRQNSQPEGCISG